jgi:hypothetical protein
MLQVCDEYRQNDFAEWFGVIITKLLCRFCVFNSHSICCRWQTCHRYDAVMDAEPLRGTTAYQVVDGRVLASMPETVLFANQSVRSLTLMIHGYDSIPLLRTTKGEAL